MVKRWAKFMGWPMALVIAGAFLATESAPVLLGTGEHAVVDWSFTYVTMRFILLPAACIIHVCANIISVFIRHDGNLTTQIQTASSTAMTGAILYFLFAHPLPLFA